MILSDLADELRAEGGLLAGAVADPDASLGAGDDLAVEAISEGERVHFGAPRVIATDDVDLGILAGDYLYAMGLSRLAERGDLAAVAALAAVIARCAQAHAEGRPADAEAAWRRFHSTRAAL